MKEVKDKEKNNFFENLGKLLKNKLGWDESVKEEVDEKDIKNPIELEMIKSGVLSGAMIPKIKESVPKVEINEEKAKNVAAQKVNSNEKIKDECEIVDK